MEFFEEAVSKTKEVFGVVSKKTGEVITFGKIKYEITSLENKKEKDFEALGRIYFELINGGAEPAEEALEFIKSINEKNAKIEELNSFIKKAKSRIICPKCGAEVEGNSNYCSNCGEKFA